MIARSDVFQVVVMHDSALGIIVVTVAVEDTADKRFKTEYSTLPPHTGFQPHSGARL